MRRWPLVLLLVLLGLSLPGLGQAVTFTAQADPSTVPVGGQILLSANLSGDMSSYPEPTLEPHEGFDIYRQGQSSSISIVNGQMSAVTTVTWALIARKVGSHVIGPLEVNIGGKLFFSNAVTIHVTPASAPPGTGGPPGGAVIPNNPAPPGGWQPPPQPPTSRRVFVEADAHPKNPFVNQRVDYTFRFFHAARLNGSPSYEPPAATGSLRADLAQRNLMEERDGTPYAVSEVKTAFFPTAPGPFSIGETRLTCQLDAFDPLSLGPDDFNSFLSTGNVRELRTDELALEVRPLPTAGRPDDFAGAVGNFEFTARLDRPQVRAGETINLILTVAGDGHPDLIGDPKLPPLPGFKVFPMKSSTELDKNRQEFHGTRTFTVPLVPTEAGRLSIHGLRFSYFDPHEERYQTIEAPALEVEVAPGQAFPKSTPAPPGASPQVQATPVEEVAGLRAIHLSSALASPRRWPRSPLFWTLQLVPLAAVLGVLGVRSWREHRERTSGDRRRSSAFRRARRGLRSLAGLEPALGYAQLYRLVHSYLEDRLGQSFTGASLAELNQRLETRGLGAEPRQQLRQLLEAAEQAGYAPAGTTSPQAYAEHVRAAGQALEALEGALK